MARQARLLHAVLVVIVIAQVTAVIEQKRTANISRNSSGRAQEFRCGVMGDVPRLRRIVKGQETSPHQYPWMAAILQAGRWNCGGALINNKYVLTAGHCVDRYDKSFYTVLLGKHRLFSYDEDGYKVFEADEDGSLECVVSGLVFRPDFQTIIMEPTYLGNGFEVNDVALVRLDTPVQFTPTVRPICLPVDDSKDYAGSMAIVTGWGKLESGDRPQYLRRGAVRVLADKACLATSLQPYFKPGMLCADASPGAACRGDSGGPLIREKRPGEYEIIGVVSWGIGCAESAPGVYSRVTYFLPWMRDNMRDAAPCSS